MVIRKKKVKQAVVVKPEPVKVETVKVVKTKKQRNRPYFTTYGQREQQAVIYYKTDPELIIRDYMGRTVKINPDEIPSLILALLETAKKAESQ